MSGGYLNIDTEQSRVSITVKKFAASAIFSKYIFFKKLVLSKDALNSSKVTVKTLIMLQKINVLHKCIKCIKVLSSTTYFKIDDNNKCFLSTKSAY